MKIQTSYEKLFKVSEVDVSSLTKPRLAASVISMVPNDLKEAAYSLGATPFEVTRYIVLPNAKSGIFAGQMMSFGRAISETMAVTMVIGNRNEIPSSIFDPANTLASVIANEFAEASDALYLSSLIQLGLTLLIALLKTFKGSSLPFFLILSKAS